MMEHQFFVPLFFWNYRKLTILSMVDLTFFLVGSGARKNAKTFPQLSCHGMANPAKHPKSD
jgi:hypothetical protein